VLGLTAGDGSQLGVEPLHGVREEAQQPGVGGGGQLVHAWLDLAGLGWTHQVEGRALGARRGGAKALHRRDELRHNPRGRHPIGLPQPAIPGVVKPPQAVVGDHVREPDRALARPLVAGVLGPEDGGIILAHEAQLPRDAGHLAGVLGSRVLQDAAVGEGVGHEPVVVHHEPDRRGP